MNTPSPTEGRLTVALLGGRGMLGSDLVRLLGRRYEVEAIDLDNYDSYRGRNYDVMVNANRNSKRFWANEHPAEDFEASTGSVMRSLFDFEYQTYVYISSPDIYEDPTSPATTLEHVPGGMSALSPYGFHKHLSEELVRRYAKNFLILRSAALLGTRLAKGVVFDIVQGRELYVTPDSRLQFITTDAVADIIETLLQEKSTGEVFNAGGVGIVTPERVAALAGKPVRVREDAEPQRYEMNTEKIRGVYGALRTSEEYVATFLQAQRAMQGGNTL